MALQVNWATDPYRFHPSTAYARIITIHADALAATVELVVGIYVTATAQAAGAVPVDFYHAWPVYETFLSTAADPRATGYIYLKTLAAFTGAIDV